MSRIHQTQVEFETPWFQIESRYVAGEEAPYYALTVNDYVGVMALLPSGDLVLVRQYRPALDQMTLEFVAGHVESGETPLEAAQRELIEEAGYQATQWTALGRTSPDAGRLANAHWGFLAEGLERVPDFTPEPEVEPMIMTPEALSDAVLEGHFASALHLGMLTAALVRGRWSWHP